jgi:UDP-arabinose 4-epimerase
MSTGNEWAVRWGPLVRGSIGDGRLVSKVLREQRIESVLHFAATAYVGESMAHPGKYFQNNVVNSLNLLDTMLDVGIKHIVFSSTCAIYGHPIYTPMDESHPRNPVNPYGDSKLFVEKALHWYGEAYGLSYVILRYFNAAGADFEGQIGEAHDPEPHLIPLAIQAARGDRADVSILGTDYATPDGTAIRDFIHVDDLAQAHIQALEYVAGSGSNEVLNLGTGTGHSVRAVIGAVEKVAGRKIAVRERERRAGDPARLVADGRRAQEVLGWTPSHDLDAIIRTAWAWEECRADVEALALSQEQP